MVRHAFCCDLCTCWAVYFHERIKWKWITSVLILLFIKAQSFQALGVAPVNYIKGQEIDVEGIKMFSSREQIFYEYYSLPFCLPKNDAISYKSENLGKILRGNGNVNTPYKVAMAQNASCKLLCHTPTEPMTWNESYSSLVIERIQQSYIIYLSIDNFIAATITKKGQDTYIRPGYYVGGIDEKNKVYINNYLKLKIAYHKHGENEFRIVGFEIEALSVDYNQVGYDSDTCNIPPQASLQYINPNGTKILFFYSVEWEESDVTWANRWDIYLTTSISDNRWNGTITMTLLLILFLGSSSFLLYKTLEKYISRCIGVDSDYLARLEEAIEDPEVYHVVYADVFRPPTNSLLFAAVIGSGIQVFVMTFILVLFFMLGIFSSASREAVGTCAIYCFGFSGLVAGYFSGRLYKTMQGEKWKKSALLTATLYPGIVFGAYFSLNFFLWVQHSSGTVLFSTMISLLGVWFGISLPLVYLGYFFGYHKKPFFYTVKNNHKPKKISNLIWLVNLAISLLMGIIPFAVSWIDITYIMTSVWKNYVYNASGFPFIIFIHLVISCYGITITMVYCQLAAEDHRWWWGSFTFGGASAAYIQLYSIHFFFKKLYITELAPTLMYFGYMGLVVITYWLFTGTISFFISYMFIRKIYAVVKLE
ncbi:transmembrane 9 superfamily member 4-like [Trichogramma pretiosum]|uniref:transmembrane 9 superfamily member 4-like n=1 Tax=Trichogramma pretiosum TaxID=7493 RepID=UPI0006C988E2|nr:transmembrane 9 superfamily member 4-like [Trichogramma pretiosum]